ncbi:hypothetical protein RRG08_021687 [Elysia crispata]|uniref:Uncharacterized protein n=1 Tax=Elysia crispata TaxID=231223 RepID=A0AAE1DQ17_9GAST|nr:hypothetical protein RRG08_021687 [Elysia crispata]
MWSIGGFFYLEVTNRIRTPGRVINGIPISDRPLSVSSMQMKAGGQESAMGSDGLFCSTMDVGTNDSRSGFNLQTESLVKAGPNHEL